MEWGKALDNLLAMERAGKRVPALEQMPTLPVDLEGALSCYLQTGSEKQIGMAVGPIPFSAIVNWCFLAGVTDPDEIDDMAQIVWAADSMIMAHVDKKSKKSGLGGQGQPFVAGQQLVPKNQQLPAPVGKVIGSPGGR